MGEGIGTRGYDGEGKALRWVSFEILAKKTKPYPKRNGKCLVGFPFTKETKTNKQQ